MPLNRTIRSALPLLLICSAAQARLAPPTQKQMEAQTREAALERFSRKVGQPKDLPVPAAAGVRSANQKLIGAHLTFSNHVAAGEWMRERSAEMKTSFGAKKFEVKHDHPYRAVIQDYVDELWTGFTDLFPEQTAGLSSPPVVIIESEVSNAFVDGDSKAVAHAVFVLTGLADEAGGVDQKDNLTGILAHEIAHSIFLHGMRPVSEKIQRFYRVKNGEPIGFDSTKDPKLQEAMARYLKAAQSVGDVHIRELHELPSPGFGDPYMWRVWGKLRQELSENTMTCSAERTTMKSWSELVRFNSLDYEYSVDPGLLTALDSTSASLIENQKQCFASKKPPFTSVLAKALNVNEAQIAGTPEILPLQKAYDSAEDAVSGLRAVVKIDRDVMNEVSKSVDKILGVSSLGYYTTEQHADDASALVHARLNRDPAMFSKLLAIMMKNIRAEDRAACEAILQDPQKVPALGSFFVIHHSYCYRIYHFGRMAERINAAIDLRGFAKDFLEKSMGASK